MNSKFEIKKATEKDLPVIFSLVRSLAEHVNLTDEVSAEAEDLHKYLFGTNGFVEALIGYYETQPVAMLIFYPSFSTFIGKPAIHIEDFYIKAEFRNMGIGTTLFKYLAELALSRDCGKIEWYAAEWNEEALKFYTKMGAEKLEKRKLFRLLVNSMKKLINE